MKSDFDEKKTALAFFEWYDKPIRHITDNKGGIWGVIPRNKEQRFALDMLMNPNIPLVSIVGKAGCGKSLLCLAAGLEQVLSPESTYKRLIVARPVQPMGKDIGFLPGDLKNKLLPWLMPIQDNLQFLMGDDKAALELYVDKGTIEIEALTYIRGRSIANAYIDQIDNVYVDATSNGLSYVVEKMKDQYIAGHITLKKGERSVLASIASKIL